MQEIELSGSVGAGGANQYGDVVAVQALLKYSMTGRPQFRGSYIEDPDGICGPKTIGLIKKYQEYLRKNGRRVSLDGRIDPAKSGAAFGKRGMWTIEMLCAQALETWVLSGAANDNYVRDMYTKFPKFRAAIPNPPIGTLNLQLASSRRVVGTLGLSLE